MRIPLLTRRATGAAVLALALAAPAARADGKIPFPRTYRAWPHVKTMVIQPGHPLAKLLAGMHHIYVNDKGFAASRTGGPYPDGSILVLDLFDSPETHHAHEAGARKLVAVMMKSKARFAATGGWGFQAFKAGDRKARVVKDAATECFACHRTQEASDFVFSRFTE